MFVHRSYTIGSRTLDPDKKYLLGSREFWLVDVIDERGAICVAVRVRVLDKSYRNRVDSGTVGRWRLASFEQRICKYRLFQR